MKSLLIEFYFIFFSSIGEIEAASILRQELNNYADLVDKKSGLNNYWNQFDSLKVTTDNNPLEWKLNLPETEFSLQFLKPLPCRRHNEKSTTSSCPNDQILDKDVEKFIELWKNEVNSSPRLRKIPIQQQLNDNKFLLKKLAEEQSKMLYQLRTGQKFGPIQPINLDPTLNLTRSMSTINCEKTIGPNNVRPNLIFNNNNNDQNSAIEKNKFLGFRTARTALAVQQINNKGSGIKSSSTVVNYNRAPAPIKKTLGGKAVNSPYVCPFKDEQQQQQQFNESPTNESIDQRLKGVEPKMIELIKNEIMDNGSLINWDDIAGLENVKRIIKEIVVYPMLRPDIFTGLRRPPKGILLFGPPGTGKTLIGKCIASQSKSTFFSISASSLTSKWVGEGEKMVRALFAVAKVEQPSVIFIDEIDSLLTQRSKTEHEASRRMKTEFLVQLDGAATGAEDRILVIGATNRPYELDEAARRRLVKRLYIPLPELEARAQIVRNLLKMEDHDLTEEDIKKIAELSDGYSGADMTNLCKEASMGPIRSIPFDQLGAIDKNDLNKITFEHFKDALFTVRPSVSTKDLTIYLDWDRIYGTGSNQPRK